MFEPCLQCQKVILYQRLKVPPAIAQSSHTLDKNSATQLLKLLNKVTKYHPKSTQEKKACLQAAVLIEAKKASPVVITHDVEPVIFLPALCHKMGIPYVIVRITNISFLSQVLEIRESQAI